MRYTPEEVAELLKDKPHQPHYIAAMVRKAIEADREGREREWQPIETAPMDGTPAILLIEGIAIQGQWKTYPAHYKGARGTWEVESVSSHGCGCCGGDDDAPTHWMPLPAPPGGSDA